MCYNAIAYVITAFRLEIVNMPRIPVPSQDTYLIQLYLAGNTLEETAIIAKVGIGTVRGALSRGEVSLRSHQQVADMTPPELRRARTEAAHDAVRGNPRSFESKCKTAITREKRQLGISAKANILAQHLESWLIWLEMLAEDIGFGRNAELSLLSGVWRSCTCS